MKQPKFYIFLTAAILLAGVISAQTRSDLNIPVNISLVKGLNMSTIKGDLNFGEIVLANSAASVQKDPQNGVLIEVAGGTNRDVIVEFDNVSLSNEAWVQESEGQEGSLVFKPSIESSSTQDYSSPQKIANGESITLSSDSEGKHFIWIGGELVVNQDTPQGDYQGNFVLTVSY